MTRVTLAITAVLAADMIAGMIAGMPGWFLPVTGTALIISVVLLWRIYGIHRRANSAPRLRTAPGRAGYAGGAFAAARARAGAGTCQGCGRRDCWNSACPGHILSCSYGLWQDDLPGYCDFTGQYVYPGQDGIRLRYVPSAWYASTTPFVTWGARGYGKSAAATAILASYARSGSGSVNTIHLSGGPGAGGGGGAGGSGQNFGAGGASASYSGSSVPGYNAYAAGGLVPSPPAATASQPPVTRPPRRLSSTGFDGAEFVAGAVRGYRWWTLAAPQLHRNPFSYEGTRGIGWAPGHLQGMRGPWLPGVNTAECKSGGDMLHPASAIPDENCRCGFWAYWEPRNHELSLRSALPVIGVIEGSGQVLIGDRGFRAQKAKIVALHLPLTIEPDVPARAAEPDAVTAALLRRPGQPGSEGRRAGPWYKHPKFTGRVVHLGMDRAPAPPVPRPAPQAVPSQAEIAEARDRAEAWMAVIGDYLAVTYPDAEVFQTLAAMQAKYPPDPQSVPPETCCEWCGGSYADIQVHQATCSWYLNGR